MLIYLLMNIKFVGRKIQLDKCWKKWKLCLNRTKKMCESSVFIAKLTHRVMWPIVTSLYQLRNVNWIEIKLYMNNQWITAVTVSFFIQDRNPSLYKITIGAYKKIFKNCSSLKSLNKLKQTKLECSFDGSSIQDGHLPQEIIWFRIQGKNEYFVLLFLAEIWLNPNCTWIIIGWTHTIFFVYQSESKINCHHRTLNTF